MISVCVDPFVLACPDSCADPLALEDYIDNLLAWNDLRKAEWVEVTLPSRAFEILYETNDYPRWDSLKSAIRALGITHIQPEDVITLVNALLEKAPSLEERLEIEGLSYQHITIEPSTHLAVRPAHYVEHFQHLAVVIGLSSLYEDTSQRHMIIITRDLQTTSIRVIGHIVDCTFSGLSHHLSLAFPYILDINLPLCCSPLTLRLVANYVETWKQAESITDYEKAIEFYIHQRFSPINQLLLEHPPLPHSFGAKFFQTARKHGFMNESHKIDALLRAIAETLLGKSLADTHPLRTGSAGNSPQRKRGPDEAWRRDIDYTYHLHYWKGPNGIQLASVVVHDDMTIPE